MTKIYLGWDKREDLACQIAQASILKHASVDVEIIPLSMSTIPEYKRPTSMRGDKLWDEISQAPMSTSHAIARFFVPFLCGYKGWAAFMDGDILLRRDIADLFALADPQYALQCVKHCYRPEAQLKKNGDEQSAYYRKNWSSVILWNCGHVANLRLSPDYVNRQGGLYLHRFHWLREHEIGELPGIWNHLVTEPALVHFTEGLPSIPGRDKQPFADEWLQYSSQVETLAK